MTDNLKFRIGDYVFYQRIGICMVEWIGEMESPKDHTLKMYYRLTPIFEGGNILSPAEHAHKTARKIISSETARQLLADFCEIEELSLKEGKNNEEEYREIIRSMDCYQMAQLFKTLYLRKQLRLESKKTFRQIDEKYLRLTQKLISGEIAISLQENPNQISERMEMQLD